MTDMPPSPFGWLSVVVLRQLLHESLLRDSEPLSVHLPRRGVRAQRPAEEQDVGLRPDETEKGREGTLATILSATNVINVSRRRPDYIVCGLAPVGNMQ